MITIKRLNRQQLHDFVHSEQFQTMEFLPISKHRGLSHTRNPRLGEQDTLLLLAYEGDELVGYLGVLPDAIVHAGDFERCGWLSCIWVNGQHRGKKIAFKLVMDALEAWDNRILITEYTGPAERLYHKTEAFQSLAQNEGIRLYLRSCLHMVLPPRKPIFEKIKPLLKAFDSVANAVFDLRFYLSSNSLQDTSIEYVNEIDEETLAFIQSRQNRQIFKRGDAELNWILNNPWVLSAPGPDRNSERYHFSSLDQSFDFTALKIRNNQGQMIAFLIFAKRNKALKLPYCYIEGSPEVAMQVVKYHIKKWRVSLFTTFHASLVPSLKTQGTGALFKKRVDRNYMISTFFDTDKLVDDCEIQDGDADCSFT